MPQSNNGTDPIALLKEDHQKVKALFDEFENTNNRRSQQRIVREAILELDVHAGIEEEIFYPAYAEAAAEDSEAEDIVLEAEEEHHVVHLLIGELRGLPDIDERARAKFIVLAENVRHHIDEEEQEMLPKAKQLLGDRLPELGERMMQRKRELTKELKQTANAASR